MAKHNKSNVIRTQFWVRELLESLEFESVAQLVKLLELKWINDERFTDELSFYKAVSKVCPDKTLAKKAFELLLSNPINSTNWYKYYNGEQALTKRANNIFDAFSILIPSSKSVFHHGKYNLLEIIESQFVGDALNAYIKALTAFHQKHNLTLESRLNYDKFTMKNLEKIYNVKSIPDKFAEHYSWGKLREGFNIYACTVPRMTDCIYMNGTEENYPQDFIIFEFAEMFIRANFFGNGFDTLANEWGNSRDSDPMRESSPMDATELFGRKCITYLSRNYGINKQLWRDSYQIFKFIDNLYKTKGEHIDYWGYESQKDWFE